MFPVLHYLDDFLLLGPPEGPDCKQHLVHSLHMCKELGISIAAKKLEGLSTCHSFFGIEMGTVKWQLRLSQEKLYRVQSHVILDREEKLLKTRVVVTHWLSPACLSGGEVRMFISKTDDQVVISG